MHRSWSNILLLLLNFGTPFYPAMLPHTKVNNCGNANHETKLGHAPNQRHTYWIRQVVLGEASHYVRPETHWKM